MIANETTRTDRRLLQRRCTRNATAHRPELRLLLARSRNANDDGTCRCHPRPIALSLPQVGRVLARTRLRQPTDGRGEGNTWGASAPRLKPMEWGAQNQLFTD